MVRDDSRTIRTQRHAVTEHLVIGALPRRGGGAPLPRQPASIVIAAMAIPVSVIGTFALMWIEGFTLNTITLLALALSVGIVIDDAIVVLENICPPSSRRRGSSPSLAAGARDARDRPRRARDHALAHRCFPSDRVHERHRRDAS